MLRMTCLSLSLLILFLSMGVAAQQSSYSLLYLLTNDSSFKQNYIAGNEQAQLWRSEIANDAIGSSGLTSDQYFTNGVQVEGVYELSVPFLYDEFRLYDFSCAYENMEHCTHGPQSNDDLRLVDYGIKFVHNLYTPYEKAGIGVSSDEGYENIKNAEYYDRPFAAWAYLARTLNMRDTSGYSHHELSLGVVGPLAQGRAIQEWAHRYPFTGPDPIDGWDSQVENRLALQYSLTYGRDIIQQSHLLTSTTFGYFLRGELGTIKNELGSGLEFTWSWPKRQADMPFKPVGIVEVQGTPESQLNLYRERFTDYLAQTGYVPPDVRTRMLGLIGSISALKGRGASGSLNQEGYRLIEQSQALVEYINRNMGSDFVRRYRHHRWYTEFSLRAGVDYVVSNYLLEGDINVPLGADSESDNQIMRDGGKLGVTLNPLVYRLDAGFDVGYKDHFSLGYRYYLRGEETREQKEPHSYSAFNLTAKTDYGWLVLPALLLISSANNYDNWPENR